MLKIIRIGTGEKVKAAENQLWKTFLIAMILRLEFWKIWLFGQTSKDQVSLFLNCKTWYRCEMGLFRYPNSS